MPQLVESVNPRGQAVTVANVLTVTSGAYTALDVMGGLITFTNAVKYPGGYAEVKSLKLAYPANLVLVLWLLNADLATPAADNAAMATVVADQVKMLAHIPIAAADYKGNSGSDFYVASLKNIGAVVKAAAGTRNIYGYLQTTVTTTPGSTRMDLAVDFQWFDN